MKDPRIDVLFENLHLLCKYYEVNSCGCWCNRAWSNEYKDQPKYVYCEGELSKCELDNEDILNDPR